MDEKKGFKHALIGNIFEWYDFTIVMQFSKQISYVFFPENKMLFWTTLLLISGHASRFFGSLLFGHIGDTFGRKHALIITVTSMGAACFLIAILPGYKEIGLYASLLLILLRIAQGMSIGGEYASALIYSVEHTKNISIFVSGLITGSSAIGIILATFVGTVVAKSLNDAQITLYGWRIALILGVIMPTYTFIKRENIAETPRFEESKNKTSNQKEISFLISKRFLYAVGLGMSVGAMYTAFYSSIIAYGQNFLKKNSDFEILMLCTTFVLFAFLSCIAFSIISQKLIIPEKLIKICFFIEVFLVFPAIKMLFEGKIYLQFFSQIVLGVLLGMHKSVLGYLLAISFPLEKRTMGVSLANNICVILSYCIPMIAFSIISNKSSGSNIFFMSTLVLTCSSITFIATNATMNYKLKL